MLDMGFIPDVERIVGLLPKIRQTLFFSATMPAEIRRLADKFLMNPKEISVSPPASPAAGVEHVLVVVPPEKKRAALARLIESEGVKSALIFCNRKKDIASVVRDLKRNNMPAAEMHGDMPQSKRMETLDAFKRGEIRLLVCSDVAARGLDILELSHVFNFDVPHNPEDYVHRIGRTGRAGRSGNAFTIATPGDGKFVAAIASLIGNPIKRVELPGEAALPLDESEGEEHRGGGGRRRRRGGGGRLAEHGAPPHQRRAERPASHPTAKPDGQPRPQHQPPQHHATGPKQHGHAGTHKPREPVHAGAEKGLNELPAFLLRPLVIKSDKKG